MSEEEYQIFDMCPFTMAKIGGTGGFAYHQDSFIWTHNPCLREHCRLWTYKIDSNKQVYAEGCSMQFIGLSEEEIRKNFELKTEIIEKNKD